MPVHHSRKCRNIAIMACCWVALQKLKNPENARIGPRLNRFLHRAEFRITESRFLPSSNYAVIFAIGAEHARKKISQVKPHVASPRGLYFKICQTLQQLFNQFDKHLPFGVKVDVESSRRGAALPRNLLDRRGFVSSFRKQ